MRPKLEYSMMMLIRQMCPQAGTILNTQFTNKYSKFKRGKLGMSFIAVCLKRR